MNAELRGLIHVLAGVLLREIEQEACHADQPGAPERSKNTALEPGVHDEVEEPCRTTP